MTEHVFEVVPAAPRAHVAEENEPEPAVVEKETFSVDRSALKPPDATVTVAVHVDACPTTTGPAQLTPVVLLFACVTVAVPLLPPWTESVAA